MSDADNIVRLSIASEQPCGQRDFETCLATLAWVRERMVRRDAELYGDLAEFEKKLRSLRFQGGA
jgi:hypothetical protein